MTQHQGERHTGRLSDLVRDVLEESPESARAYLRESWLSAAIRALRDARRKANLTQAEIADRMGTTQPAVARLENDREGRTTLHRYVDYALACGELPLDIVLEPVESVREFAIDQPSTRRTQACYQVWTQWVPTTNVTSVARSAGQAATDAATFSYRAGIDKLPFEWHSFGLGQHSVEIALAGYPPAKLDDRGYALFAEQNSPRPSSPNLAP